jgi:anti-sigma factor RsiW
MTHKEAIFLLSACPHGGSADPEFAEALELAGRDPELAAWLADQRRFDAAIAARLQGVPAPADLRARILAGGRLSRLSRTAHWYSAPRLWAIAAMLILFAGAGAWHSLQGRRNSGWNGQVFATLSDLLDGREKFDVNSPNVSDLQAWLREKGAPSAADLPARVRALASLGCKTLSWNGHPVSIICFHGPGGELVHLAMVQRDALASPPPEGHPVFGERDGWRMASWSQGDMAMMLVTRGPQEQLRQLLAGRLRLHGGPQALLCIRGPIAVPQLDEERAVRQQRRRFEHQHPVIS